MPEIDFYVSQSFSSDSLSRGAMLCMKQKKAISSEYSLSPVANFAFILGTVGEEEYHLRL